MVWRTTSLRCESFGGYCSLCACVCVAMGSSIAFMMHDMAFVCECEGNHCSHSVMLLHDWNVFTSVESKRGKSEEFRNAML